MNPLHVDVAVLGGGFGGSLMAMLLARIGLNCVLIERGCHPRFAIGESSTPVADLVLANLAREYDLPRLAPLAKYGSWKRAYPEVMRGLKRGFSYFHHTPGETFEPSDVHHNELLVAASSDDEIGDTHWLRSDVDAFFFSEVERLGVPTFDRTHVTLSASGHGWRLAAVRESKEFEIQAKFVIDATGGTGIVPRALNIPVTAEGMHTHSRAIYGHFADVVPWQDVLTESGARVADHPFDCDYSALHQLIDEGWMWQLRFDNGITSAGFVIDSSTDRGVDASPQGEWRRILDRYPSLARQFADSRQIEPADGLHATRRMQRLASQVAGGNWALLPNAAGFVDPLHSTGIAHTLCGIERLTRIFAEHWRKPTMAEQLTSYSRLVRQECELIDLLVHGCYATRKNFRAFTAFSMLYFAAATTYERRRLDDGVRDGFLCADDPQFVAIVKSLWTQLPIQSEYKSTAVDQFEQSVAWRLRPYNYAGLCDPAVRNMYARTALPTGTE